MTRGASKKRDLLTPELRKQDLLNGRVRNFVCEAFVGLPSTMTTLRVGAVGNRVLRGFPSPCGRVLGVHRDGSVHARRCHSTRSAS